MKISKIFKDGLINNNTILVQLVGLCSVLAISSTLKNCVTMSAAVLIVTTLSNTVISMMRKIIPSKIRIPIYIVVIATFVTIIDMFLNAFMPDMYKSLGLFIPLIVVNCMILARAESFASKNKVIPAMLDGIASGLGYTFAICFLGFVRELIGSGSIWGHKVFSFGGAAVFVQPPGAFIVLGIMVASFNYILNRQKNKKSVGEGEA